MTAIETTIQNRISDIKDLINCGWTKEAAIEYVKSTSTLGPKSWETILKSI